MHLSDVDFFIEIRLPTLVSPGIRSFQSSLFFYELVTVSSIPALSLLFWYATSRLLWVLFFFCYCTVYLFVFILHIRSRALPYHNSYSWGLSVTVYVILSARYQVDASLGRRPNFAQDERWNIPKELKNTSGLRGMMLGPDNSFPLQSSRALWIIIGRPTDISINKSDAWSHDVGT